MKAPVTVCIPTIPPREAFLARALASVEAQTLTPAAVSVYPDLEGLGAAGARNAAMAAADTEWVAFLDDDDWLLPKHLDVLLSAAEETGADLVYPWFESNGTDPLYIANQRAAFRPFDELSRYWLIHHGNFIPVTTLVRREVLLDVGGFAPPPGASASIPCEDWGAWRALALAGAKFYHVPERTWHWQHWHGHTGGRPWT